MGVRAYWYMLALILVFAMILPQQGRRKKYYIILMAVAHSLMSGFRYEHLTGDLQKYHFLFMGLDHRSYSDLLRWKNGLFYIFEKFIRSIFGNNFQVVLLVTAVTIEISVAILVYKYSPRPWLSYLVWDCIGFYVFGFSALRQSFAMAFVAFSLVGLLEDDLRLFLVAVLIAGGLHRPALVFLPAYWIARTTLRKETIFGYGIATALIYAFRRQIAEFMANLYYDENQIETALRGRGNIGGRYLMMIMILVAAFVLKGFADRRFNMLFNMMLSAAVLQLFSGFNNIFTRFSDFYFQFSILFLPLLISDVDTNKDIYTTSEGAVFRFDEKSLRLFCIGAVMILIYYYYVTCLSVKITYEVDNYLNYRTMWDVISQ